MFTRVRLAIGVALVAILMTSVNAFAKGGFDFITITGPDLKEPVQVTDTSLTEDFFAFANFYENKTKEPVDPGKGYEITRHYVQGASNVIFDRLHYYPETSFVFYDGIENGESEYDGEWYTASPEIRTVFESVLAAQTGSATVEQKPPVVSRFSSSLLTIILFTAGLAALFSFALWRRKHSFQ